MLSLTNSTDNPLETPLSHLEVRTILTKSDVVRVRLFSIIPAIDYWKETIEGKKGAQLAQIEVMKNTVMKYHESSCCLHQVIRGKEG